MRGGAQKKALEKVPSEPEYFEDASGARVEVREELRTAAAGIRREVARWTGGLPAAVPMQWPAADHLLQQQANMAAREVGAQPLYQWGGVVDSPAQDELYTRALAEAPAGGQWSPSVLEQVARLQAAGAAHE